MTDDSLHLHQRTETIQPYDSDHTALVHVLWAAQRNGVNISDPDELASHIMRSNWLKAVKQHAKEGRYS